MVSKGLAIAGLLSLGAITGFTAYLLSKREFAPINTSQGLEQRILAEDPASNLTIRGYSKSADLGSLEKFLEVKPAPYPLEDGVMNIDLLDSPQFLYLLIPKNGRYVVHSGGSCNIITQDGFGITSEHVIDDFVNTEGASLIFFDPVRNIKARTNVLAHSKKYDFALLAVDVPSDTYKNLSLAPNEQINPAVSYTIVIENPSLLIGEVADVIERGEEYLKDRTPTKTLPLSGSIRNSIATRDGESFLSTGERGFFIENYFVDKDNNPLNGHHGNSGSAVYTQDGFYQGPISQLFGKSPKLSSNPGDILTFGAPTVVRAFIEAYISRKKRK